MPTKNRVIWREGLFIKPQHFQQQQRHNDYQLHRRVPDQLYHQVANDIRAIEQLLQAKGYEPGVIVSFRYMLCTFIDETALGHGWNAQNDWVQQSLLVHFHNETWGGEKVYLLLERLLGEPKRYQDLLEFIYLCFCLGYRGRYKVTLQNSEDFDRLFRRLHHQLQQLRGEAPPTVLHKKQSITHGRYNLANRLTIKRVFWWGLASLTVIYLFYALNLHHQTQDILQQLNNLLSKDTAWSPAQRPEWSLAVAEHQAHW